MRHIVTKRTKTQALRGKSANGRVAAPARSARKNPGAGSVGAEPAPREETIEELARNLPPPDSVAFPQLPRPRTRLAWVMQGLWRLEKRIRLREENATLEGKRVAERFRAVRSVLDALATALVLEDSAWLEAQAGEAERYVHRTGHVLVDPETGRRAVQTDAQTNLTRRPESFDVSVGRDPRFPIYLESVQARAAAELRYELEGRLSIAEPWKDHRNRLPDEFGKTLTKYVARSSGLKFLLRDPAVDLEAPDLANDVKLALLRAWERNRERRPQSLAAYKRDIAQAFVIEGMIAMGANEDEARNLYDFEGARERRIAKALRDLVQKFNGLLAVRAQPDARLPEDFARVFLKFASGKTVRVNLLSASSMERLKSAETFDRVRAKMQAAWADDGAECEWTKPSSERNRDEHSIAEHLAIAGFVALGWSSERAHNLLGTRGSAPTRKREP